MKLSATSIRSIQQPPKSPVAGPLDVSLHGFPYINDRFCTGIAR